MEDKEIGVSYEILKWTYGLVPIVAGLDKFFNLLTDWTQYLSPLAKGLLPIDPELFMGIAGIIEITVGVAVLSYFTRYAAAVASIWLFLIGLNLLLGGFFDVAVRDIVMAIGAFVLYQLATVHDRQHVGSRLERYTSLSAGNVRG